MYASDWQLSVNLSVPFAGGEGGMASQKLTAGVRLTALDGYDNLWDTAAFGATALSAYFYQPAFPTDYQYLSRDFRFDSYPKLWDFYVSSDQDGQPVTMTWKLPPATMGTCSGIALALTDVTGGAAVDLTQASYSYANNASVTKHFQLIANQVVETPPSSPSNLFSPRVGTSSVLLAWTGVADAGVVGYQIYRRDPGSAQYKRLTASPVTTVKYSDANVVPGSYSYLVVATSATGCEGAPSNALPVHVGQ